MELFAVSRKLMRCHRPRHINGNIIGDSQIRNYRTIKNCDGEMKYWIAYWQSSNCSANWKIGFVCVVWRLRKVFQVLAWLQFTIYNRRILRNFCLFKYFMLYHVINREINRCSFGGVPGIEEKKANVLKEIRIIEWP